jgi:hypothetical protein
MMRMINKRIILGFFGLLLLGSVAGGCGTLAGATLGGAAGAGIGAGTDSNIGRSAAIGAGVGGTLGLLYDSYSYGRGNRYRDYYD